MNKRSLAAAEWLDKLGEWFVPEPNTGCWLWNRRANTNGYGMVVNNGRVVRAHRLSYVLLNGPIPSGSSVHHVCNTPACVNPAHLAAVSHRTNMLSGKSPSALHAAQTHCRRGHEFSPDNTYRHVRPSGRIERHCVACRRLRMAAYYVERRVNHS